MNDWGLLRTIMAWLGSFVGLWLLALLVTMALS